MRPRVKELLDQLDKCIAKLPKKQSSQNGDSELTEAELRDAHTSACIYALQSPQLVDKPTQ